MEIHQTQETKLQGCFRVISRKYFFFQNLQTRKEKQSTCIPIAQGGLTGRQKSLIAYTSSCRSPLTTWKVFAPTSLERDKGDNYHHISKCVKIKSPLMILRRKCKRLRANLIIPLYLVTIDIDPPFCDQYGRCMCQVKRSQGQ